MDRIKIAAPNFILEFLTLSNRNEREEGRTDTNAEKLSKNIMRIHEKYQTKTVLYCTQKNRKEQPEEMRLRIL